MSFPGTTSKPRIAVVEDDADLRDNTVEFLAELGYPAWGADCGEDFFRRLAEAPVDVVVLDVELPDTDGFTIAERLHATQDIAIVMATARSDVDDRITGLACGADTYLVKPVDLRELVANLDALARRIARRAPVAGARISWRLDAENWQWSAPNGTSLKLTAKEYLLVRALTDAGGATVTKTQLSARLDSRATHSGFNRIDVLLSRLRKKGELAFGQQIPIKAITAIGYAMTAQCTLT
ncbi:MAG: response regulator transcription factor [Rhodocyclaceae bacterium]